jgi:DNA-binding winged helix-turn-helix (wHTH) protein/tetratricopeptide (TPR) repeat protein/TolB-like protein
MPLYRFAGCELDPAERRLVVNGRSVTLTPKVFDTLLLLVERAGHAVGKDELMTALWPRGFVHESNLTKHIWLIRKAIGDDGDGDARCIETVPKFGYRFVAPVEVAMRSCAPKFTRAAEGDDAAAAGAMPLDARIDGAAASANDDASSLVASPTDVLVDARDDAAITARRVVSHSRGPRPMFLAVAAIALVVCGLIGWRAYVATPKTGRAASSATTDAGTAVAIVDFNNLSQNAKDAWLGPALAEMLGVEIAAGEHVYVLPDELVRPARAGLSTPLVGGYAAQSLATLRRRVGADYVLSGSYLVSGDANAPTLRIDVALQNATTGTAVANVSQTGTVADLAALVTHSGETLRRDAGFRPASAAALQSVANAQPPTADVARRIGFALDALHRSDPARARDELLDAIAEAPGYAPAYSYLALAWSALGYDEKAAAAAEQAATHAKDLPKEQQLLIDVQRAAAKHDWRGAVAHARELVALQPDDPNHRLHLIQWYLAAHDDAGASAALVELRALPSSPADPRVELAASLIATDRDDPKAAAELARKALALAIARDEPGQIADARNVLGTALYHLGDKNESVRVLDDAIATYQANGNPHGEAHAREILGNVVGGDAGREQYQRAMSIYQSIGDLHGVGAAYSDVARMLWTAGDRDGSEAAVRRVLETSREDGDTMMQAWALQALATAATDESADDDVVKEYRDVLAIYEQNKSDGGIAWTLGSLADLSRLRGELDVAEASCGRARKLVTTLSDPQFVDTISFICGLLALDRGDVDGARAAFADVRRRAESANDPLGMGNVDLMVGQIDFGTRAFAAARDELTRSADLFAKAEATAGEANAVALLALVDDAMGDKTARERDDARAKSLRVRINEKQEVFAVDIARAQLRARTSDTQPAIAELRAMAADATRRHWIAWALEARLAEVDALTVSNDAGAPAARAALLDEAHAKGFGWIVRRLGDGRADAVASRH